MSKNGRIFQVMVPVTLEVLEQLWRVTKKAPASKAARTQAVIKEFAAAAPVLMEASSSEEERGYSRAMGDFGVDMVMVKSTHSPLASLFTEEVQGERRPLKPNGLEAALEPLADARKDEVLQFSNRKGRQAQAMDQYSGLTFDDAAALSCYTYELKPKPESVYYQCNAAMRKNTTADVGPWRHFILLMMLAMAKLPPVKVRQVFRGYKCSAASLGFKKGERIVMDGFASTTQYVEVMKNFLGKTGDRTMLILNLTRWGKSLKDFSRYPKEEEILLPPKATFIIESEVDLGHGITFIQAQQIESVEELLPLDALPDALPDERGCCASQCSLQ